VGLGLGWCLSRGEERAGEGGGEGGGAFSGKGALGAWESFHGWFGCLGVAEQGSSTSDCQRFMAKGMLISFSYSSL